MSEVKVNKISPRTACGTVTLGDSGDTFTIPSGATITNAGTASGFGATGETSWDTTVKTTGTFTATAGVGYFLNTTGGTITVNLPAGAAGSSVAMVDYAGTWQTSAVTVSPNGSEKMGGVNADITLSTEGQSVTFVYIDGTQGWVNVLDSTSNVRGSPYLSATGGTITTSGDYKIHKFTGPGTFTVSGISTTAADNTVSYMVVGGGGGGTVSQGGAGGAGGFREYRAPVSGCYAVSPLNGNPGGTAITVTATGYPITVGGGGTGNSPDGCSGSPSIFSTVTSTGGGGGGTPGGVGCSGGSGGGSGANYGPTGGGTGNSPPTSPAQGTHGGGRAPTPDAGGGAGGGATAGGSNGNCRPSPGSAGGAGATTSITASPVAYAGGGGGGQGGPPGGPAPGGAGGTGGGGNGGGASTGGQNGTTNLGGGGGAGSNPAGNPGGGPAGNGGSGVVVLRYKYQ